MSLKEKYDDRRKNFIKESHQAEIEKNDKTVIVNKKEDGQVELILEPNKFNELSNLCRLTQDEFIEAIDEFMMNEEDSWGDLRMKDQCDGPRDMIIRNTILKYAEQEYGIVRKEYEGISTAYTPRINDKKELIGDQIIIALTKL